MTLPLFRHFVEREDRFDGALGAGAQSMHSSGWMNSRWAAPNALVLARVDAIDRTHIHTRGVLGADAGFRNHVSHGISSENSRTLYLMTKMGSMKSIWNPRRALVLTALMAASACGSSSSSSTAPTLVTSVQTTTITITSAGVSPNNIEVALGTRVLFINGDSRTHNMTSDPHPEHTDCTAINSVGFLQAGQQLTTGNLTTARTCKYHDHDDPDNAKLKGQITIK